MSLIVEFELETPILRSASESVRRLRLEEMYGSENEESKILFWAFDDAFDGFESALTDDESVAAFEELERLADRRLYGVVLSEWGAGKLTYPIAAEHSVAITDIVVEDRTLVRARVPSRDALFSYRDSCLEQGVDVVVERIYRERDDVGQYDVTEPQREALLAALEWGYFDVPRAATLSEVAAALDISDQALSARLRRGQANLLRSTIRGATPS